VRALVGTDRQASLHFLPCKDVEQLLPFVQQWRVAMVVRTRTSIETEEQIALKRNRLVLEQARAVGLLGEAKNTRLSGRVPAGLIEAAKKRAHVSSDTELLELALSRLALEDDFGARLVRRKGSVPADIDLAI
jgi:hypothetical protein